MGADEADLDSIDLPGNPKIITDEEDGLPELDDDLIFSDDGGEDSDSLFGGALEADDY